MLNYIKALFVKDVNALLGDLMTLVVKLRTQEEKLKNEIGNLAVTIEDKKAAASKASKAAGNIEALFN